MRLSCLAVSERAPGKWRPRPRVCDGMVGCRFRFSFVPKTRRRSSRAIRPPPRAAPGGKTATVAAFANQHAQLGALQSKLFAEKRRSLLAVLQGIDTSGKDGTIRHVFGGLDPSGARVATFGVPTYVELAHDFLWRVHKQVPGRARS